MNENIRGLFFTNGTASHVWRIDGIARRANELTPHQISVANSDQWHGETFGANIVIIELLSGYSIVDTCHNLGAKVIYEADDAIIDTYGRERKNLMHVDPNHRSSSIETIRKCDAVTVTSEELKENYTRFTDKPIYVLPIYMDYQYYDQGILIPNAPRNTDEIRIGWFGGKGHFEDVKMIMPALKNVLARFPNVKFVYCGWGGISSDNPATLATWGEDVFKDLPRSQREFMPGAAEDFWPYKHRFMDLDIGIAPLIDDNFNRHKVFTKWLEYSVLETPVVVSPMVYDRVVKHGKTGLIAKDVKEWEQYLTALILDKNLRMKIGKSAAEDVRTKHNLEDHWMDWIGTYQKVLAS